MMTTSSTRLIGLLALILIAGCRASAPSPPLAPQPLQNVILLLPNEDRTIGSITVANAGGSQQLTQANTFVTVDRADAAPSKPVAMEATEIQRLFGRLLAFIPTPESRFSLYFDSGGTALTTESLAILPHILDAYKERRSTDISIIGHTDTTGNNDSNYRLGLARAEQVRKMIDALGVDKSYVFIESHGAHDLLVPTESNVSEPRNRRVEVVVR